MATTSIISLKCISEKELSGWNSLTINSISQNVWQTENRTYTGGVFLRFVQF